MSNIFSIGVFAVIFNNEGEVLLVHRNDYDLWNIPGGGMESGETPGECIIREVKEETGYDVIVDKILGIYSKPQRNDLVITFICNIVGGELQLNAES